MKKGKCLNVSMSNQNGYKSCLSIRTERANRESQNELRNRGNKIMTMGRPTIYSQELLEKAVSYIVRYEEYGDEIPSNVGLALHLGISQRILNYWANDEDKKDFLHILDCIQSKQQQVLINKGLNGDFNSNICKLVLGKHGFHDKQETELSGPGGGPIKNEWSVEYIDPKIANASDSST